MEELTLRIPAQERWAVPARMAAHGAGAVCGLGVDALEDVRMAVDEACDLLTHQPARATCIQITCAQTADGMRMTLCALRGSETDCPCKAAPLPDLEVQSGILRTLCRDVQMRGDARGVHTVALCFAKEA